MRFIIVLVALGVLSACGSSGGGGSTPPQDGVRVDYVTPDNGPQDGGTPVAIRGAGFSAGVISVLFGGVAASDVEVTSDNNVNCTTPPNARGTVDVQVSGEAGTGYLPAGFTYNAGPEVFFVAPAAGYVGLTVSIVGFNFVSGDAGPATVYFGADQARSVQIVNDYTIFCTVPPSSTGGAVDVTVVNRNGEDTLRNGFVYLNVGLAGNRLTLPFDAEDGDSEWEGGVIDADLSTGIAEVYLPLVRGDGHAWRLWRETALPFAPDRTDETE